MVILPWSVNLIAFPTRLRSACLSLPRSVRMTALSINTTEVRAMRLPSAIGWS